jgi:hypothetical protein
MSIEREEAYRQLAESTAFSQRTLTEQQDRITNDLTNVSQRLANIERILQQVD